ncbi:MAG: O-antigen ligase family protein, partial [Bacteroidales bacterium]|nr:O-antigen ligase family protein [Bacteroidales bacterium]
MIFYWLLFFLGVKDAIEMHWQGKSLIPYFLYAVIITAVIFILNIDPGTDTEGRKTVMDMNSNILGQYGAFATIMAVDMLARKPYYSINRGMLLVMLPIFVYMVAGTGSRGAVFSVAGGLLVYFVFFSGKNRFNPLALFFILLFGVLAVNYMLSTELIAGRMEELEDDYRLRVLWPAALEIFNKFPIFGTGAARFEIEMTAIIGRYRPLHNEFLTILIYTCLAGM